MKAVELDGTGSTPPSDHVHWMPAANALASNANICKPVKLFCCRSSKKTYVMCSLGHFSDSKSGAHESISIPFSRTNEKTFWGF